MTVQELISRLQELPDELKSLPVKLRGDWDGESVSFGELRAVRAKVGDGKIWWMPDTIELDSEL